MSRSKVKNINQYSKDAQKNYVCSIKTKGGIKSCALNCFAIQRILLLDKKNTLGIGITFFD